MIKPSVSGIPAVRLRSPQFHWEANQYFIKFPEAGQSFGDSVQLPLDSVDLADSMVKSTPSSPINCLLGNSATDTPVAHTSLQERVLETRANERSTPEARCSRKGTRLSTISSYVKESGEQGSGRLRKGFYFPFCMAVMSMR